MASRSMASEPRPIVAFKNAVGGSDGTETGESLIEKNCVTANDSIAILRLIGKLLGEPNYEPSCAPNLGCCGRRMAVFPHCRQQTTWDCGVACTQLVLRWLRPSRFPQINSSVPMSSEESIERRWIVDAFESQFTWTIDIVVILRRLFSEDLRHSVDFPLRDRDDDVWDQANFLYFSKHLGVDVSYKSYSCYRDTFERDESRVVKRFAWAKALNLPICEYQMDLKLLADVVSREECIAIVLLDNSTLRGTVCHYAGQYVLLVGISTDVQDIAIAEACCGEGDDSSPARYCLIIMNSDSTESISFITPSLFEKAWRADGTDRDVILIAKVKQ